MLVLAPFPTMCAELPRRSLLGKDDVVLGAFAVDQRNLNDLSFRGRQQRIDLTVDRAADTDEYHAPLCDSGAKRIA